MITDILFSFFSAVKKVFINDGTSYWDFDDNTKASNVLQTTVGYQALLNILVDILTIEKDDTKRDKVDVYVSYLINAKSLRLDDLRRYPFTSKTKSILYFDISLKIWPPKKNDDFRLRKLKEILNQV